MSVDITERRRAEEAAEKTQRLLRLVLDTLPVGVHVMDGSGTLLMSNPAIKRIWGGVISDWRERSTQGKGYWHDDRRPIAADEWASQVALKRGETVLDQLVDIETFDGKWRTIRNSAAPIRDEQHHIVGAVVINEDVTDQVRARSR